MQHVSNNRERYGSSMIAKDFMGFVWFPNDSTRFIEVPIDDV